MRAVAAVTGSMHAKGRFCTGLHVVLGSLYPTDNGFSSIDTETVHILLTAGVAMGHDGGVDSRANSPNADFARPAVCDR